MTEPNPNAAEDPAALAERRAVEAFFAGKEAGVFVEVGAHDPVAGSQTWHLEQRGWGGLLVEPLSSFHEALVRERPGASVARAACGPSGSPPTATIHVPEHLGFATLARNLDDAGLVYVRTEEVRLATLDTLLDEAGIRAIDFLSIDVEGTELGVLQGLSLERFCPRLILIEDKLQDLSKHRHLTGRGYRLVKRTSLNNWYVPRASPFALSSPVERLKLLRKVFLGLPFRRLRRWRHARRR